MEEEKIVERLKFYADTPQESNKYFCWTLSSIATLKQTLWGFLDKGWNIRAAWYEKINISTGEILENKKLNIISEMEERFEERKKKFPAPLKTHLQNVREAKFSDPNDIFDNAKE